MTYTHSVSVERDVEKIDRKHGVTVEEAKERRQYGR